MNKYNVGDLFIDSYGYVGLIISAVPNNHNYYWYKMLWINYKSGFGLLEKYTVDYGEDHIGEYLLNYNRWKRYSVVQ
jgi:hypothetical protein